MSGQPPRLFDALAALGDLSQSIATIADESRRAELGGMVQRCLTPDDDLRGVGLAMLAAALTDTAAEWERRALVSPVDLDTAASAGLLRVIAGRLVGVPTHTRDGAVCAAVRAAILREPSGIVRDGADLHRALMEARSLAPSDLAAYMPAAVDWVEVDRGSPADAVTFHASGESLSARIGPLPLAGDA